MSEETKAPVKRSAKAKAPKAPKTLAAESPKAEGGNRKSEGRKNLKALREGLSKLNSVQLKNFYAGMNNIKSIKNAVDAATKECSNKEAKKIEKQIAKLQKQLDQTKGK